MTMLASLSKSKHRHFCGSLLLNGTHFAIDFKGLRVRSGGEAGMEGAMKRKNEGGQALVFAAVGLVVIMGFAGLGIDMGMLRYQKRLPQTAADWGAPARE